MQFRSISKEFHTKFSTSVYPSGLEFPKFLSCVRLRTKENTPSKFKASAFSGLGCAWIISQSVNQSRLFISIDDPMRKEVVMTLLWVLESRYLPIAC